MTDESANPLRQAARLILASAYAALRNSAGWPIGSHGWDYRHRVLDPKPGDWVFETSAISGAFLDDSHPMASNPLDHLGILVRREPYTRTDEETGEMVEIPGPYYWIIHTLDGREQRWGNADFAVIVIPDRLKGFPGFWK